MEKFRESAACLAAQMVVLEQTILRDRVAEAEEEIEIVVRGDVRQAALVALDADRAAKAPDPTGAVRRRDAHAWA